MCHCCQYSEKLSADCTQCHGREFIDSGLAIEKLEEILEKHFPNVKCLRLDKDSTSKVGMAKKIIEKFRDGEAQILLGTQMVAKGYDFPNVNLVGIIDGDTGLGIPDFRAHERIFQLITQVSGRAGRHSKRGKVFLQTFNPNNIALKLALNHDFEPFYKYEIVFRKELFYPPFCRLFKVEFTGKDESKVASSIEIYSKIIKKLALNSKIQLIGPSKSLFAKRKGNFRWQLIGKGKNWGQLQWLLKESFTEYNMKKRPQMNIIVDMDPIILV